MSGVDFDSSDTDTRDNDIYVDNESQFEKIAREDTKQENITSAIE